MKITDIKIFKMSAPTEHKSDTNNWLFVKIYTDSGIHGVGEGSLQYKDAALEAEILDFGKFLIDKDPFQIEFIWNSFYRRVTWTGGAVTMSAISAIDIALWDIKGKALDVPVYELMGGKVREKLRTYTYIYPELNDDKDVYTNAILAGERAVEYKKKGFDAVKFDPVGLYKINDPRTLTSKEISFVENFIKIIREAVGEDCDLLIGTHGQMTADSAIRLSSKIEKYDPFWLEEPVPPNNMSAMVRVASQINFPVATGERLTTKYEFNEIIEKKAASILQLNMGRVGGILEGKKIASMADANHISIAPHMYCGPIVAAANIQVAASISNFLILEGIKDWRGFDCTIMKKYFEWEAGSVLLNDEPGLGVQIDEDKIENFPYDGDSLHLEMSE